MLIAWTNHLLFPRRAPSRRWRFLVVATGGMVAAAGCSDAVGNAHKRSPYVWRTSTGDTQLWFGTPVVEGERLFVPFGLDLAALDTRTGAVLWRAPLAPTVSVYGANLAVDAGVVYVGADDGATAFDAATGARRWHVPTGSTAEGSVDLLDDATFYVGTRSHEVLALDRNDGHARWTADLGPGWTLVGSVHGIARSGDTLYATVTRRLSNIERTGVVVALDRRDGHEIWRFETATRSSGFDDAPRVWNDLLLLSDIDGGAFFALDRATGHQRWRTPTTPEYLGPGTSPQVVDGVAYGASYDAWVYALRPADGHILWAVATGASNTHFAICGSSLLAESEGVAVVDIRQRRLDRVMFDGVDDLTTSGFAIVGRRAFVAGTVAVYAFDC